MKFNTGFFDGLFGKKTTIEVPQDDGTTQKVVVTEAWLKKTEAEGKISISKKAPNAIPFHVIGPDGSETQYLQIGKDIPQEQYEELRDPKDGTLYGLTIYENGELRTTVISKKIWEQAKTQFDEIDQVGNDCMVKTIDKFKNF